MKKIVTIGGGTGSYTLLKGLKDYPVELTAIVSMTDDGGSTGRLRDEYGILPPGDVRRCIAALSDSTEEMINLFQHRFKNGGLKGHSFGNLFITALKEMTGSDQEAIKEACRILSIKGNVLPVTLNDCKLCAELEDGQVIIGETNIDIPKHDGNLAIKKVFLKPNAKANKEAVEKIKETSLIIIGPGDLYGSVVSNLIVKGISEAIQKSKAKKVYVCNLMTKFGETNNFKVSDFVERMEEYLGKNVLDYVIYNKSKMKPKLLKEYEKEKAYPVVVDEENFKNFKANFIEENLTSEPSLIRHNSEKLARVIMRIVHSL